MDLGITGLGSIIRIKKVKLRYLIRKERVTGMFVPFSADIKARRAQSSRSPL